MPYHIKSDKSGYYVVDYKGRKYSSYPLSLDKAKKQLYMLNVSEGLIHPPKYVFNRPYKK